MVVPVPPNTYWAGPELEHIAPDISLALTGGMTGLFGYVIGRPTSTWCKPGNPPHQQTCTGGCAGSNGDPHLLTTNGFRYDFQAAGEFTLLRSPDGSLEIQARQEPYPTSSSRDVAINTSVAARANGHRITISQGTPLKVQVDGAAVDLSQPRDLGSGAAVRSLAKGVEVDFPDGTVLSALNVGAGASTQ